jgi:tetratricopeptide (TPR) repeat protein
MECRLRGQSKIAKVGAGFVKIFLILVTFCSLWAPALPARAQTFEIPGQSGAASAPKTGQQAESKKQASTEGVGWGSSIEVARLSRAAEQALAKGNATQAADYAARAVQAAPQNNRLWFLLGYTARLAGRYPQSVEAYQRGLHSDPGSIEGLSGLAQTYMRQGKSGEAERLLLQVIAANPRRPVDLAMAGELFLRAGDTQRGADLLQRSETMAPGAHTEVMLATAYMKLGQTQRAKQLLDTARVRGGKNVDVFRAVANYYREMGDYKSAVQTLRQLQTKDPEVLAELGSLYALNGDKKEAAETYAKAAAGAPRDIKILLSAAEAQVRLGDYDGARRFLARSEALNPNYYRLHAIRAEIARTDRRTPDAIKEYQLALEELPAAGVPEGVLYPIQLRLELAEQDRAMGDEAGGQALVQRAQSEISQLDIRGMARPEFLRLRASVKAASDDFAGAEADLREALKLEPASLVTMVQYAALLWRNKRPEEARKLYEAVLAREPDNRYALESMGYLAREQGDNQTAEQLFQKLLAAYPDDFVPYSALGDLYTAERRFPLAQENFEAAYKLAPSNPQIVAGGAHAAIEAHQFDLTAKWLAHAQGAMKDDVRIMRQQERYFFHEGKFLESAQLGRKVLEKAPNDREGSVYLAYDLYNLGRYDEALEVSRKYQQALPREANFPLLAGHAEKQSQLLAQAVEDYTRAIAVDPGLDQAYLNRGYVLNDLQNAQAAAMDFQRVLNMQPQNGVAHLGLSFSYLQLHQGKLALAEADQALSLLGESGSTHLARAGALRQMRQLPAAEKEYRAALKFMPGDLTLQLALADTLYHLRRYGESIGALKDALALSPDDAGIYGKMAHAYARLHDRDLTLRYVQAAEQQQGDSSAVLLDTGDALLTLGDSRAAMERFTRALDAPDANRVDARLLIAKLMADRGRWEDARQQVSLAFAEARIGESSPVSIDNLVEAANLFLAMHDFDLAQTYFLKAKEAGAGDQVVAIGLANTYLAMGDAPQAQEQLAAVASTADLSSDFDYTMALANVYRERWDTLQAMGMFARANALSGQDDAAERGLREMAGDEGLRVTQKLSLTSDLAVTPIFDDSTIYTSLSRLNNGEGLITPHSLLETRWTDGFRLHEGDWPLISGFFELRNARGTSAVPSLLKFLPQDTSDYIFNGGIAPIWRRGRNYVAFHPSLSFTLRRDSESPVPLNQNLFRESLYLQTSPFWNWLAVRGSAMHESGPFTEQNLSSRDLVGNVEFQVGRPWGSTALLTGYRVRDLRFNPRPQEWFQTASYAGLQRKFGNKLTLSALGEYVRAWSVLYSNFGAAQMMRPAFQADYRPNPRWEVNGNWAWSRGQGDHVYDNVQSGFFISYVRPWRRKMTDGAGEVAVEYPLQLSLGLQQQEFYQFSGNGQQFRPVFRLTVF